MGRHVTWVQAHHRHLTPKEHTPGKERTISPAAALTRRHARQANKSTTMVMLVASSLDEAVASQRGLAAIILAPLRADVLPSGISSLNSWYWAPLSSENSLHLLLWLLPALIYFCLCNWAKLSEFEMTKWRCQTFGSFMPLEKSWIAFIKHGTRVRIWVPVLRCLSTLQHWRYRYFPAAAIPKEKGTKKLTVS